MAPATVTEAAMDYAGSSDFALVQAFIAGAQLGLNTGYSLGNDPHGWAVYQAVLADIEEAKA